MARPGLIPLPEKSSQYQEPSCVCSYILMCSFSRASFPGKSRKVIASTKKRQEDYLVTGETEEPQGVNTSSSRDMRYV